MNQSTIAQVHLSVSCSAGAHGQLLERLVLHAMKEAGLMLELCRLLVDLEKPAHYRLSGLLLQVGLCTTASTDTILCASLNLQCFDAVGWAAGRASGL